MLLRPILTPIRTKKPQLIDLTLSESEIHKDFEITPKPARSLHLTSPRNQSTYRRLHSR